MTRELLMVIVIVIAAALLLLMLLGWRARARRQAHLPAPASVPLDAGAVLAQARVLYVATTAAGAPLDRITVSGLGFRARAELTVREGGLVLGIPGQADVFIPRSRLIGADRATWTIDRVVESDGLVLVAWLLGEQPVDSYFRIVDETPLVTFVAAVADLARPASEPSATEPPATEPPATESDPS